MRYLKFHTRTSSDHQSMVEDVAPNSVALDSRNPAQSNNGFAANPDEEEIGAPNAEVLVAASSAAVVAPKPGVTAELKAGVLVDHM